MQKTKIDWKAFVLLQIALFVVSFGAVCSKMAGRQTFLSFPFLMYYGILLAILMVYAFVWQQVLKKISLMVAYASKGVGIVYGILWGYVFFDEEIKWNMLMGAFFVLIGVYCYIFSEIYKEKS